MGGVPASLPLIFGKFLRDIDFFSSFQMGELTLSMGGGGWLL